MVVSVIAALFGIVYLFAHDNAKGQTEIARIGGIEIGQDSLVAVNHIKEHFGLSNLETEGDSIGLTSPDTGEKFYVKILDNKVTDILYYNKSLDDKQIDIATKSKRYNSRDSVFHIGKNIVIDYNGKGLYHVFQKK